MDDSILPEVKAAETSTFLQQAQARNCCLCCQLQSPNTWKAYRADLRDFTVWCQAHDLVPLPAAPETVAAYLTGLGAALQSINHSAAAVGHQPAARSRRLESPTHSAIVRLTMQGIRRTHAPDAKCAESAACCDQRDL